jgi:ribose 5-phosphate isomerase B
MQSGQFGTAETGLSGGQRIVIGSDHGGFLLKIAIIAHLGKLGILAEDCGCYSLESADHPVIAHKVCKKVLESGVLGILVCGTGIGMSIAANKIRGIRAAVAGDTFSARMAREHNNANVLCIGGRVVGENLTMDIVDAFLRTEFTGKERYARRIEMYDR